MPRSSVRDFSGGWWAMGTKDDNPPTTLRRAKGVGSLKTKSLLSRWGSTQLYALNAHSLFKFAGVRFQGAGDTLYRDGISIRSGLTGTRLTFVKMPPSPGDPDSLFCAGGGSLFKIDQAGVVTGWGIDPPPDGFAAVRNDPKTRTIDDFENAASWTAVNATLADETTIKQTGTKSMKMSVGAGVVATAIKAVVVDLTHYADGTVSPDADFLSIWARVDNPANLVGLECALDVGAGDFSSDYFTFPVNISLDIPPSTQLVEQVVGAGSVTEPGPQITPGDDPWGPTPPAAADVTRSLGQTTIVTATGTWVRLRIPKVVFNRVGSNANTFRDVHAIRLTVKTNTNGSVIVYWDTAELLGQAGLQGSYKYKTTFLNSVTGSRSNANPTPVSVSNVMRSTVTLSALPISADPQVDKVEIWRTIGNGVLYFKIDDVANGIVTYVDRVADFSALDTSPGAKIVQNTQLPVDNIRPDQTLSFIFGPFQGCMFWCGNTTAGNRGKVYYSPIGRPEGVANFIVVTSDDDPTQCGVIWNGSAWVFSQAHLYQIQGDGNVFVYTEVKGVIGTVDPYSAESTPVGILYQAKDGLRIFTGIESIIIGQAKLGAIYKGETIEGVGPFEAVVTAYGKDQLIASDTTGQTLAVSLLDHTWRYFGIGVNALFYESDTGLTIATLNGAVVILEDNLVETDNGIAIPFEVEIPSVATGVEHTALFQRLYLKMNTQGQLLTPTIIIDGVEIVIPAVSTTSIPATSGQAVEIPVFRNGLSIGVRLTGNLTKRVEIVEVAADLYLSEAATTTERQLHGVQVLGSP